MVQLDLKRGQELVREGDKSDAIFVVLFGRFSVYVKQLYDYGYYNLRQQLAPVPGVTFPAPDGGKYRQIMVDILVRVDENALWVTR